MHPGDSGFLGALYYLILAYFTLFLLGAEAGPPIPLSDAAGHFAGMDEWAMGGEGGFMAWNTLEWPGIAWFSSRRPQPFWSRVVASSGGPVVSFCHHAEQGSMADGWGMEVK